MFDKIPSSIKMGVVKCLVRDDYHRPLRMLRHDISKLLKLFRIQFVLVMIGAKQKYFIQ